MGTRFSAPVQIGPGTHPASCTMGTGSFPVVKSGRGVTLTFPPFYSRSHKTVELYLYCPYGPYGLYRASVPVQGCTLPLPYDQHNYLAQNRLIDATLTDWYLKTETKCAYCAVITHTLNIILFNLLKPTGYVMHQQFNIQQLYALPTLYLCVLYLSQNKQRLVPLTA